MQVYFFNQNDVRFKQAMIIRTEVFINEQGINPADEIDGVDNKRTHLLGYIDNQPVATARLKEADDTITIQRVAILKAFRHLGLGHQLIEAIEEYARKKQVNQLIVSSQDDVVSFYTKIGFIPSGTPGYMDAGIPHTELIKKVE